MPSDITVAGYIPGIFVSKKVQVTYERFSNYILDQYEFTSPEKVKVLKIIKGLYYPMQNAIKYGIDFRDRTIYSSNNGFVNISNNDDTILEIRLS